MKNISITALTQGKNIPSSRFRWRQYVPFLSKSGFSAIEYSAVPSSYPPTSKISRPYWASRSLLNGSFRAIKSNSTDIRFLQRELITTIRVSEVFLKKPLIFDVDDAIFVNQRWDSIDKIAKKSSVVICGNNFLASYFCRFGKVEVLPTAINTAHFLFQMPANGHRKIIGWSGTSGGFKYLYSIEDSLRIIMEKIPECFIKIVADCPPRFTKLPSQRVIFEKWKEDCEVSSLSDFSVGIMPLENNIWSRGKCSFKMLTYMAVGIPVVVSPVGMNNEVLAQGDCGYAATNRDEWIDAISYLLLNEDKSRKMGFVGRKIVEEAYSLEVVAPKLVQIIKSCL